MIYEQTPKKCKICTHLFQNILVGRTSQFCIKKTPHILTLRASYGVSIVRIVMKIITAPHRKTTTQHTRAIHQARRPLHLTIRSLVSADAFHLFRCCIFVNQRIKSISFPLLDIHVYPILHNAVSIAYHSTHHSHKSPYTHVPNKIKYFIFHIKYTCYMLGI